MSSQYGAPAVFISHSLGGPTLQAFFNATSAAWKEKYVAAWFPVEGVWLGAPKVAKAIISGDNFGTPAPEGDLIDMERTLESPLFLLPLPSLWPKSQQTIVYRDQPPMEYNTSNFDQLLTDLNISSPLARLEPLFRKRESLRAPGVRVYCIHGVGVETPISYQYSVFDRSSPEKTNYGDGDGTVPLASLAYCQEWSNQQTQPVVVKTFPGVEHVAAVMDTDIFEYISSQMQVLTEEYEH